MNRCPGCDTPSGVVVGPNQALCITDRCRVLRFDPGLADGGLSQAGVVVLSVPEHRPDDDARPSGEPLGTGQEGPL